MSESEEYCPVCNSVRMAHCAAPEYCGNTKRMDDPTETVTYCPHCHCKTWHVEGVCEWAGGHKVAVPQEATPAMLRAAWDEGGLPTDNGVTAAEELAAKIWRAMVAEVAKQ